VNHSIYLDNAATSHPKPPAVREALLHYHDHVAASAGRGAYREAGVAGALLEECRAELTRLIGGSATERLIFTLNCTDALNLGIKGVVRPGDHVVTTWMDHNSILRPLHRLEEAGVVTVTRVRGTDDGRVDPAAIAEAIRPETRLVATLHASNVSGGLLDAAAVGRICRSRDVLYLLDAAQTVGAMPVDVSDLKVDLLAFPGHKGLMGPLGTGALWMSDRVDLETVREGGTGSRSEEPAQPTLLPDRYEPGSHNLLGLAGLLAAARALDVIGLEAVAAHKRQLSERFLEGAARIPGLAVHGPVDPASRVAVWSVTVEGVDVMEAGRRLDLEHGIKVRSGLHCAPLAHRTLGTFETGTVRLSAGWYTSAEDVDRSLQALRSLRSVRAASSAL